jgi:DnaJ-class molecular chaperone
MRKIIKDQTSETSEPKRVKGCREAHVKTCPDCSGDGVIEKGTDDEQQCPTCGGSGFVPDDDDDEESLRPLV